MKGRFMLRSIVLIAALLSFTRVIHAHDQWLQLNTNVLRVGDAVQIDLMLGNHGNNHRDFKLAGKADPATGTLEVRAPDGKRYDLREGLVDTGYTPKEGFWTTRFVGDKAGLYMAARLSDKVVSYAPKRSIQSAKAFFVLSRSLDQVPRENPGFATPLGHALELVPDTNPVTPMGPGQPIRVRLLFKGKPLADETVSFIPRNQTLAEEFDPRFERKTSANGLASYTPTEGNHYLVVAHREADEAGEGYRSTKYSATLCVYVPQICPCCGE
jgi:uncharacterized GH25 family protein